MKLNTVLFKLPVSVALVVSLVAIAAGIGVHLASTQQRLKGARATIADLEEQLESVTSEAAIVKAALASCESSQKQALEALADAQNTLNQQRATIQSLQRRISDCGHETPIFKPEWHPAP